MISDKCVITLVVNYMFLDHLLFGSYIQHSMLSLLNENSDLIFNKYQKNIVNNYGRLFGKFQPFSHYSL